MEHKKIQPKDAGVGPEYHRIYSVEFEAKEADVSAAVEKLKSEINFFSPQWIASFEKKKEQEAEELRKNDEFEVHLSGPWQAPVRVKEVGKNSFSLVTLEGHPEAGQIRFEVLKAGPEKFKFQIESLSRSKDSLVDFFYDKIPVIRVAQQEMWERFCKNFARFARQPHEGIQKQEDNELEVKVITEKKDEETEKWTRI